jgi:hypothetical protein
MPDRDRGPRVATGEGRGHHGSGQSGPDGSPDDGRQCSNRLSQVEHLGAQRVQLGQQSALHSLVGSRLTHCAAQQRERLEHSLGHWKDREGLTVKL